MRLNTETLSKLEAMKAVAAPQSSFTPQSRGVWQGGRMYVDDYGNEVFIPIGTRRTDTAGPLTYVGDAIKNVKGWLNEVEMISEVT